MDESLDGQMDEWMDVKGNYWGGGTYHNTVLVYLIKRGIFDFLIHYNKLLWMKAWMGKWMNGWMLRVTTGEEVLIITRFWLI